MDERILQLKQLKKEYKKQQRKLGRGWKILGSIVMHLCFLAGVITLFVLGNELSWIQYADNHWWEPAKAALALPIPYADIWLLAADYGILAYCVLGMLGILLLIVSHVKKSAIKRADAYLAYRTLKLTLDTKKEESL